MLKTTSLALLLLLLVPLAAPAAPRSADSVRRMGNGTKITCTTTPTLVDDPTLVVADAKWLTISSPSGTVHIGGPGVGDGGTPIDKTKDYIVPVAKGGAVYCWASSSTTINVVAAE